MHFLFIILLSLTFTAASQDPKLALDKVVVVGKIPGPDLWMVNNGDNTMWILGTQLPMPKKMKWESKPVEVTIKESQAFITYPSITTDLNFFQQITLIPSVIGIENNPEKKKLRDVLPTEVYDRWLKLKSQYIGKNKVIEESRPMFAAHKLYQKALKKSGLSEKEQVYKKVRKIAKRNRLKLIKPEVKLAIKKPRKTIKKFKKSTINDLECFTKTLDRVEKDIPSMLIRAEAWASGDITRIKSLDYPDQGEACDNAFMNSDIAEDTGTDDLLNQVKQVWLEKAQQSLNEYESTFAVLPISDLVGDNNYLDDLRAMGFTVVEPK